MTKKELLKELEITFDFANQRYFGGKLERTRMFFSKKNVTSYYGQYFPKDHSIEINTMGMTRTLLGLQDTLVHEMIHYYDYMFNENSPKEYNGWQSYNGWSAHGKFYKDMARMITKDGYFVISVNPFAKNRKDR